MTHETRLEFLRGHNFRTNFFLSDNRKNDWKSSVDRPLLAALVVCDDTLPFIKKINK